MAGPLPTTEQAQALLAANKIDGATYNAIINANKGYPEDYNAMQAAGPIQPPPPVPNPNWNPTQADAQKIADAEAAKNAPNAAMQGLSDRLNAQRPAPPPVDLENAKLPPSSTSADTSGALSSIPSGGGSVAAPKVNNAPEEDALSSLGDSQALRVGSAGQAKAAEEEIGKIKSEQGTRDVGIYDDLVSGLQKQDAERKVWWQQAMDSQAARDKEIQDKVNNIKQIDPNHWWHDRGVGGSILAGISMALGAAGAVMSGMHGHPTHNFAQQIIDNAIGRDIDAQKANVEAQWNQITKGQELNKNAAARDAWKDEQYSRMRQERLLLTKELLARSAATTDSQLAKQNAQIAMANIDSKLADVSDNATIERYKFLAAERQRNEAAASAAGAGNQDMKDAIRAYRGMVQKVNEANIEAQQKGDATQPIPKFGDWYASSWSGGGGEAPTSSAGLGGGKEKDTVVLPDGTVRRAISSEAQTAFSDTSVAIDKYKSQIQQAKALLDNNKILTPAQVRQYNAHIANAKDLVAAINGSKRLPGMGQITSIIPETGLTPLNGMTANAAPMYAKASGIYQVLDDAEKNANYGQKTLEKYYLRPDNKPAAEQKKPEVAGASSGWVK